MRPGTLLLSVLAFAPFTNAIAPMGQGGVEPPTSRLSGVRSNHLSYWPGLGVTM